MLHERQKLRGIAKDTRKRDVMQISSILSRGMNEPTYDYTARLYYLLFLLPAWTYHKRA